MQILVSTLTPFPSRSAHAVHITATAAGLVDAGHDVTLVSAQRGPGWPGGDRTPDTNGFAWTTLADRDHRGQSITNSVRLISRARATGPDAAFADDVRSGLALALAGIPVVVELHSMQFHMSALSRAALRRLARHRALCGFVTISGALRDDLVREAGIDPASVTVLPEAARPRTDEELAAPPPAWLGPTMRRGALQVGYSGSLYGGRGVELMVELARRLPDIDLHVLGGPETAADALRDAPLRPSNLVVHGPRPLADAERLQHAMDVLLAPYGPMVETPGGVDTSRWMSPMKVFEYLAAGRAMVCSDLPVLREILSQEMTALLVGAEDIDAWATAVRRLRDDPTLRNRLGEAGRAAHADRFTWRTRTDGLLGIWAGRGAR